MTEPTVIYYRWTYSPSTGDVTLSHNHEGHPTDVRFHTDMAQERPESDLLHGFAHKSTDNWSITDDDSRPVDDPNLVYEVVYAITKDQKQQRLAKLSYDAGDEKWAWIEGQRPERWSDAEIGGNYDAVYEYNTQGETVRDTTGDAVQKEDGGIRAHFEVLVEMAMRDPQIAEHVANWEGHSYQGMDYSSVARAINESGKKWAIGVSGYDMPVPEGPQDQYGEHESYGYESGLQMGAHGPTTTKEDVERAMGEPVVMPDANMYGLKGDYTRWEDDDLWDDDDPDGSLPQTQQTFH